MATAKRRLRICNERGLHARASAKFAETAEQFDSEILVMRGDAEADGKSILDLLTLAAIHGSEIRVQATGTDAEAALTSLAKLVETRFGESG